MVSHILRRDRTYPKQVSKGRRELESRVLPLLKLLDEYQGSLPLEKRYSLTSLQFPTLKCVWGFSFNANSSGSRLSEPILAQARKSRPFSKLKADPLAQARELSLRRGSSRSGKDPLTQARILSLKRGSYSLDMSKMSLFSPRQDNSRSGETTLAQARMLQYSRGFHPPRISKEEIERRNQQSLGETVKNRDILSAGYLTLEDRLVHYFLTYVILPKFSNYSQISDIELQLMYAIKFNIKTSYPRQPAPTDEPEPTAEPHQPESLAQSSSSAAMPTNQMIMDELVSLRGYITTRMDVFDTQSQQIHYELHRLSSRLSNMDVDEDSYELESYIFCLVFRFQVKRFHSKLIAFHSKRNLLIPKGIMVDWKPI
ncbi:hypothetical protein Lal_00039868 [Lupinus albus]|nr:hypothetical protein Lal_00039868 [Lupinus albus]